MGCSADSEKAAKECSVTSRGRVRKASVEANADTRDRAVAQGVD